MITVHDFVTLWKTIFKMKFTLIIIACLAGGIFANPLSESKGLIGDQRGLDLSGLENTVINLLNNLVEVIDQIGDTVTDFISGLESTVCSFEERVVDDIRKLRTGIDKSVGFIADRFSEASSALQACIEIQQESAEKLFNRTLVDIRMCGRSRVDEVGSLIKTLASTTDAASEFATETLSKVKSCYDTNAQNILALGQCIGGLAIEAELKSASFMGQIGLLVGRINFSLAGLPGGLEMCAGAGVVQAGVTTGQIVFQIISCTSSTVASALSVGKGQGRNATQLIMAA